MIRGFWKLSNLRYLLPAALFLGFAAPSLAIVPQSATLAWNQEADPTVAGYCVLYGTASGAYTQSVNVGATTTATISDLNLGTTYYFVVTAYNSSNQQSAPSQEVSFTVSPYAGSYTGAISGSDAAEAGTISLDVLTTGAFTGSVVYGGQVHHIKGSFGETGSFQTTIPAGSGTGLGIALNLADGNPGYTISGSIVNGTGQSQVALGHAIYGRHNPSPYAGEYTVLIESSTNATGAAIPPGAGAARLTVTRDGTMLFAGTLADGTHFAQSAVLTGSGVWNLYLPLYPSGGKPGGMVEGSVKFEDIPGVSDLDGTVTWVRPANPNAACFPVGFTMSTTLIGSAYSRTGSLVVSATNGATFAAAGGDLPADVSEPAMPAALGPGVVSLAGSQSLSMRINRANGMISGKFINPGTGADVPVFAAIFQKQGLAAGSFLNRAAGIAGSVELTAP